MTRASRCCKRRQGWPTSLRGGAAGHSRLALVFLDQEQRDFVLVQQALGLRGPPGRASGAQVGPAPLFQLGHRLLQTLVLPLKVLQTPGVIDLQPAIQAAPPVGLLRDPKVPTDLAYFLALAKPVATT